jgi:hypothetical protein
MRYNKTIRSVETMDNDKFEKVEIGLNYGTTATDQKDVIYLEQHEGSKTNGIIAITVEEAEWLSEKLKEYVKKIKITNSSSK